MLFSSMMVPSTLAAAVAKMMLPFVSTMANLLSAVVRSAPASRAYERPMSLLVVMIQFLLLPISVVLEHSRHGEEGERDRGGVPSEGSGEEAPTPRQAF